MIKQNAKKRYARLDEKVEKFCGRHKALGKRLSMLLIGATPLLFTAKL